MVCRTTCCLSLFPVPLAYGAPPEVQNPSLPKVCNSVGLVEKSNSQELECWGGVYSLVAAQDKRASLKVCFGQLSAIQGCIAHAPPLQAGCGRNIHECLAETERKQHAFADSKWLW